MFTRPATAAANPDKEEILEWLDSLAYVLQHNSEEQVAEILKELFTYAYNAGVRIPFDFNTPYINTIGLDEQPQYPGKRDLERKIKSIIRWNAMTMVVRANRNDSGVGGHISTFASAATLLETGFNHFFRARSKGFAGDMVYFQGHAAPGVYARAFLEGRIDETHLDNFRREMGRGGGLSSYPHPRLMPGFWQFATVSMGLGPIMSIYQARFAKYLENRGLKPKNDEKIWVFLGDGETDEPEALGAINLASREKLNNLIFVVNCNLQRLDGPVRGNGKIIQELGGLFQGSGWKVLKVIWGSNWDQLLDQDNGGLLVKRMGEAVDGDYQKYSVEPGSYIREHFFGRYPELLEMVKHYSDDDLRQLNRGGHDPQKVFAAYKSASKDTQGPVVILAKTIKGYGMGESGEGKNVTHQQKKLNEAEVREFRTRFGIPISDEDLTDLPFYKPDEDSPEMRYLHERRKVLGGYLPERNTDFTHISYDESLYDEFADSSGDRAVSSTMVFVKILSKLLKDKDIGKYVVPIVPDEARTFGMEALFRQAGIYASTGQVYEPVDNDSFLYYKESKEGQILEEGITEAGAMSSFIAAGTAYANYGVPTVPFFIYYSMFGFQRIGDLAWAAGDMMAKGFMLGGTAGRTTLNGEGLQHQDGHSHVLASVIPNLVSYDPAFGYELAIIIKDGIRRMYKEKENIFYYITIENENYPMPARPDGCEEGVLKGVHRIEKGKTIKKSKEAEKKAHILVSASIMGAAYKARQILEDIYEVSTDIWSVTSYNELRRDGLECERYNFLNPSKTPRRSFLEETFAKEWGYVVCVSDYMRVLPDAIAKWIPLPSFSLGTDGFGKSETRENLRQHFEINAEHIAFAVLSGMYSQELITLKELKQAAKHLGIDPLKSNPMSV